MVVGREKAERRFARRTAPMTQLYNEQVSPGSVADPAIGDATAIGGAGSPADCSGVDTDPPLAGDFIHQVFERVRARTGRDFTDYKLSVLARGISRRMRVMQLEDPTAYLECLRTRVDEVQALVEDLLIHSANFFRDPDAFASLANVVIPRVFEARRVDESIRVWSVGCATGEEAYSLAMLLLEEVGRRNVAVSIQVFATDLHSPSLERAREGFYSDNIEHDVGADRLARFFTRENRGYRIRNEVREIVVFSQHNLLVDPPFVKLDLIACRNLLSYFDHDLHQQIAELFHYALQPEGFLFLGDSERIGSAELFRIEDEFRCLYQRRNVTVREPRLPAFPLVLHRRLDESARAEAATEPLGYGALHDRLREQHGPPSLLVSPEDNIVHVSARASRYLVYPSGLPTSNVLRRVRDEFRTELTAALSLARSERKVVRTHPVSVRFQDERSTVVLDVCPAFEPEQEGFVLLVFDERSVVHAWTSELGSMGDAPGFGLMGIPRLRDLEEEEGVATLLLDRELRILRFTPRIGELFNVRSSDHGRPLFDITTRLGYPALGDDAREVLLHRIAIEHEVRDDTGRWYLVRVIPYRSADDRTIGVAITFVDITRQKLAEEEVREAKRAFERIIETLPQPLLVLTADLRIHSANAAFYAKFMLSADEMIGCRLYEIDEAQWDMPKLRRLLDDVLPNAVGFEDHEVDREFKRIGYRIMSLHGRRLGDTNLILLGMLDITERRETELAVREREARLVEELTAMKRLHEVVNRLLASASLETALDEVLLAAMEMTGATMGNVQLLDGLRGVLEIIVQRGFDQDFLERFRMVTADSSCSCGRALRSRQRTIVEDVDADPLFEPYRNIVASARFRGVQSTPLLSRKGELIGMMSTHYAEPYRPSERDLRLFDLYTQQAADFVEHKRAEDARRRSERQLGEENRNKDEYLAMLGHELRNPLGAIRSATQLLKADAIGTQKLGAYEVLERQSSYMSRIIDGLLDVSRIARRQLHLDLQITDVREVVGRVLQARAYGIEARGLRLTTHVGPDPLWVLGDDVRLTQVFDNLVGNAVKFTPLGGTITVTLEREDVVAVVRIRDTGVGIQSQMLSHIFEAFRQETRGEAYSTGGLGLGLALARGLVDLHRGTVVAYSGGPGMGAEFIVRLPVTSRTADEAKANGRRDVPPRRILVVEDNTDAAEMLRLLLEASGHDVNVARNGDEALAVLGTWRADVVLCDLGLPGMSGRELARSIRRDVTLQAIPLIAVTGYGRPEDRKRAKEAGFDEHLVKPVDAEVLNRVIGQFAHGRASISFEAAP